MTDKIKVKSAKRRKVASLDKKKAMGGWLFVLPFVIGFLLFEPIATYAAACIIIFVSQRFTYYSKVTFFLGKICLGVYLFLHYASFTLIIYLYREYLWVLLNAGFIIEAATMIYAAQYGIEYSVCRIKAWISKKRSERIGR